MTVPAVINVPLDFTVAVIVNADPLLPLEGLIESEVVVVCAAARTLDIARNKSVQRETKQLFRKVARLHVFV